MARKRWTRYKLERHDAEKGTSVVRRLEMLVDEWIRTPEYSPQFWRDVGLYGVDEAILYVRNANHGNADKIREGWEEILRTMDL